MGDSIDHMISDNKNVLPEFLEALFGQEDVLAEIVPVGIFNRPSKDEIERYEYIESLNKRIYYTNRTSVYDGLPERIFHQSKKTEGQESATENAKEQFKRTRQEEANARDFFNPFDRLLQDLRIEISRYNYSQISAGKNNFLSELFDILWEEYAEILTVPQKIIFMRLVANRQHILGHMPSITAYLSLFTGEEVSIEDSIKTVQLKTSTEFIKHRLGVDFALGSGFEELSKTYEVRIGPIEINKIELFLQGRNMDRAIRFLLSSVMPLECIYTYVFKVKPAVDRIRMYPDNKGIRLGYSSIL